MSRNRGRSRALRGSRGRLRGRGGCTNETPSMFSSPVVPPSPSPSGFTLAEEARQTSQHDHSSWGRDSSLRNKPVTFLSAGKSEPLKDADEALSQGQSKEGQGVSPRAQQHDTATVTKGHSSDTGGLDDSMTTGPRDPGVSRGEVPQSSECLEPQATPVFFFDVAGQKSGEKSRNAAIQVPERHPSPDSDSSDEIILFRGRNRDSRAHHPAAITIAPARTDPQDDTKQTPEIPEIPAKPNHIAEPPHFNLTIRSGPSGRGRHRRRGRDHHRGNIGRSQGTTSDDDSMLADYIANMRANGEIDEAMRQHSHNQRDLGGTESDASEPSPRAPKTKGHGNHRMASNPDAGTEYEAAIKASTRTSDAPSDPDSDVHYTETKLVNKTLSLSTLNARRISSLGADTDNGDVCSSDSDSPLEDGDPYIGSTIAEDSFDLMDWERPSLRRKKGKGARAQLNLDDCDSEIEQQLQAAWKNDRLKKKQRKQQREELRALGQLGRKTKPDDLRVKYPTGMTIQEVAAEVRTFLMATNETLSFPPMDLNARKAIHELANRFNIKSKSTGKADQRRPTLYRTGRTLPYVESTFDMAVARIRRPYLPRVDVKRNRGPVETPARGSYAAASYRDGEIVGAAAPELGTENRGRTMLERMGWSSGTALGATHNKGILQPVTHAMKRSKAGLG